MDYQSFMQRSCISRLVQPNKQTVTHPRQCSAPPSLSIGNSTALPTRKNNQIPISLKKSDCRETSSQQDGVEDSSVQQQVEIEEVEEDEAIKYLDSVRVVPPNEDYTPPLVILRAPTSIYSLDLPTVMSDQNEFALYPKFGKLNCLNLLHLQQHLYELEQQLAELNLEELSVVEEQKVEEKIAPGDTDVDTARRRKKSGASKVSHASILSTRSAGFGGFSVQEKADREAEGFTGRDYILQIPRYFEGRPEKKLPLSLRRCKVMGEVEITLGAYNKTLLNYSQIINLPTASMRDTRALKKWLQRAEDPLGKTLEALRFLDEGSTDVIALCARKSDILENFFQSHMLRILEDSPIWSRVFPSIRVAVATNKPTIQSQATLGVLRFLISLGGALLILAPVVVLYFTRSEWGRLMIICVCTILFATVVHLFTASEKKEVLMATTGYTAVLVVFVGSEAFAGTKVGMPN